MKKVCCGWMQWWELQILDPETLVYISYLLYWELAISGGTEVGRCSVLLQDSYKTWIKHSFWPIVEAHREQWHSCCLPSLGESIPHQGELLVWGCNLHTSTAPMGKLLLCKINLKKGLSCVILLHSTTCINKIYLIKGSVCSPALCYIAISF